MVMPFVEYWNDREKALVSIPGERLNPKYGQFGRTGTGSKLEKAYTASVWSYRCANILGNNSASMPYGFEKNGELVTDTYAEELFGFVNEKSNWEDLIRNTVIDMNVHGRGFWFPDVVGGMVIRITRLPASQMSPNDMDQDGQEPSDWLWTRGAFQSEIRSDQLITFRLYGSTEDDPDSPTRIITEKAYGEQKIDELTTVHFDHSAIPPYMMSSEQRVSDTDLKRYDAWWKKRLDGVANKLRVAWAGSGLKPFRMRAPLKEMVLKELREIIRLEICAAYGVPLAIAGGSESIFKATWVQQVISMHHMKIIPDLKLMAGVINAELMPLIDPNLIFKFLPEKAELLQEERTARSERVLSEWKAGLINQDKALMLLNYEPEDAGPGLKVEAIGTQEISAPKIGSGDIEKAQVRKKAIRLIEENGNLDGFEFTPRFLDHDEVFQIVEGVVNETG